MERYRYEPDEGSVNVNLKFDIEFCWAQDLFQSFVNFLQLFVFLFCLLHFSFHVFNVVGILNTLFQFSNIITQLFIRFPQRFSLFF